MKPDLRASWNYTLCLVVTQTAVSVIRHSHALPTELPIVIVNCMEKKTRHTHKNTLVLYKFANRANCSVLESRFQVENELKKCNKQRWLKSIVGSLMRRRTEKE